MSLGLKKWNSPQFDSTILLLFEHGWIKNWFWNCDHLDAHSGDQRRSTFPWGTQVRIDFTREKIKLATPQCRLVVLSQISEQRLRFWVGFVCQVQKAIQHLTLICEMLSQNNTSFLDTVQVVQEKVMFCWYWKHGQEAEKSYYLLFGTFSNSAEAKKKHFCRLFHNQGINFTGLSNTFPERAATWRRNSHFVFKQDDLSFVLFYSNSKSQRLFKFVSLIFHKIK